MSLSSSAFVFAALLQHQWQQDDKVVAVASEGGTATATALAAMTMTLTMTMTIPCPLLLTSLSSGPSVFATLDQRQQWDGNRVAVVDKVGRTVVDRDKRDGATHCNDNNNHSYPVVADVVIIWRLCLCGNGMTTAVAEWQQRGKDRGSGRHSPAKVMKGS
jgi:hypothetical protein